MSRKKSDPVDVAEVPFSRLLGLRRLPDPLGPKLGLPFRAALTNHLGTLHASAQLALAEAASGQCLQKALPELADRVVAVVRGVDARFRSPATKSIRADARIDSEAVERLRAMLERKGIGRIEVTVEVRDAEDQTTAHARYEWLLKIDAAS